MGGRQESLPTLAVNGGPIKAPAAAASPGPHLQENQSPDAKTDVVGPGLKVEQQQQCSSPIAGPSSLDLNTAGPSRCVAFNKSVVVVGGGAAPLRSSLPQMHKCRSLPRLTSACSSSCSPLLPGPLASVPLSALPLGLPHLHSAMLSSSDLMLDVDQLSMAGNVGLLRSMSARTVDSLAHIDRSLASSHSGSRFLSPSGEGATDNLAARSTSCPSMAYPLLTCRTSSHFQLRPGSSAAVDPDDVNLDGEEITDLPIEPMQNFPDLIPELREDCTPDSHEGNLPLYTDYCDGEQGASAAQDRASSEPPENNNQDNEKKGTTSAPDGKEGKQTGYNVSAREKCIRWLKSLSVDKS